MKDSVPSVVARFFNVAESDLTDSFVLPPERLQGSISRRILHAAIKRMAGADLPGVWKAATYGELIGGAAAASPAAAISTSPVRKGSGGKATHAVGIDIEQIAHLPWSGDPSSDPFYVENFTPAETAYALRQSDPRQTLCGLWCAKEATIKCGQELAALQPVQIEIFHDENGRPRLTVAGADIGCEVSISHADGTAVAVCIRQFGPPTPPPAPVVTAPPVSSAPASARWSGSLALVLSAAALIVALVSLLR